MSRTKANKVFAICAYKLDARGLRVGVMREPDHIALVIARHKKGAISIAKTSVNGLVSHAYAVETDASNAKAAINYKKKETA